MAKEVEAVYENGVLRPLEPLELEQGQRVRVRVVAPSERQIGETIFADPSEWAYVLEGPRVTREDAQRALADMPGSLSEAVIAEREED